MSSAFQDLWHSTKDLHQRFFPDNPPSFEARVRVFNEEVGEFLHAVYASKLAAPNEKQVALEFADVLVTAMGLLQGLGIGYSEVIDALNTVASKNDAKTLDTHQVNARGKIERLDK